MITRLLPLTLVLALWGAGTASAQTCEGRRLDGAADAAGSPEVTFVEGWRPALDELRGCLDAAPADTCLEVQGQFDDRSFSTAIERSMGSAEAAQHQRARARAQAVMSELASLGVDPSRLRERPPQRVATYRGVEVRVRPSCLAAAAAPPPAPPPTELPAWLSTPESAYEALRAVMPATSCETASSNDDAQPQAARTPGPFTLEAGGAFGFQLAGETDAFAFAPRIAFGWQSELYVRAFLGAGTADELEQRAFVEWGLGVGGFLTDDWTLGAAVSHRMGTYRVGQPIYEHTFLLGVTSEQRLADLGAVSVWLHESVSPVGLRFRQGEVQYGRGVNIPDRLDYAVRAEIMLLVRGHFGD